MDIWEAGTQGAPQVLLLETEENPVTLPAALLSRYHFLIPVLELDTANSQQETLCSLLAQIPDSIYALCATADCWTLGMETASHLNHGLAVLECSGKPGSTLISELWQNAPSMQRSAV